MTERFFLFAGLVVCGLPVAPAQDAGAAPQTPTATMEIGNEIQK